MTERLPLFPLGTVLFPGMELPLRVFEERYRTLVDDLLTAPAPRRFGVVAIELGHEVGEDAALRLADTGCVAEIQRVTAHPDGTYDLRAEGGARFHLKDTDRSLPYVTGTVEPLPEEAGPEADTAGRAALAAYRLYRHRMRATGLTLPQIALGPAVPLSHRLAAAVLLDGQDKQRLLAAEDAARRLRSVRALLLREAALLHALPTVPAGPFLDGAFHPN